MELATDIGQLVGLLFGLVIAGLGIVELRSRKERSRWVPGVIVVVGMFIALLEVITYFTGAAITSRKDGAIHDRILKLEPTNQIVCEAEAVISFFTFSSSDTKIGANIDSNLNAGIVLKRADTQLLCLVNQDCQYVLAYPEAIRRNDRVSSSPIPLKQWVRYEFRAQTEPASATRSQCTVGQLSQVSRLEIHFDRIPNGRRILMGTVALTFTCPSTVIKKTLSIPDQRLDQYIRVDIPDGSFMRSDEKLR